MKQKTIKTDKTSLLVCELPEGAYYPNICQLPPSIGVNYLLYENGVNTPYKESLDIPKGNWQLIGRLPEITEEQWKGVVDYFTTDEEFGKEDVFRDYLDKSFFDTATESGVSLLQSNEVYFENHLGEKPVESEFYWGFLHDLEKWQEAQSKVWDKERCFLFLKIE